MLSTTISLNLHNPLQLMDEERIGQILLQRFKGTEKQNWNPTQTERAKLKSDLKVCCFS